MAQRERISDLMSSLSRPGLCCASVDSQPEREDKGEKTDSSFCFNFTPKLTQPCHLGLAHRFWWWICRAGDGSRLAEVGFSLGSPCCMAWS